MPSLIADLLDRLDTERRYEFEERAGTIEFDSGVPRDEAEALALIDLLRTHPAALLGVTALEVERDGESRLGDHGSRRGGGPLRRHPELRRPGGTREDPFRRPCPHHATRLSDDAGLFGCGDRVPREVIAEYLIAVLDAGGHGRVHNAG